jgi:hypothetical protein
MRAEPVDSLPFVPRMDLWYRANNHNNTLPAQYKDATLDQILADLDLGYHAVIPDFQDLQNDTDDIDRALGLFSLWYMPWFTELAAVERIVSYDGDITTVEYHTPKGNIRTRVLYDEQMKKAGITITHILEHAIKSVEDIEPLIYIFDHLDIKINYPGYDRFAQQIGDRGVAVAYLSLAGSPMHFIMRDLVPLDKFFFMLFDNPQKMKLLAKSIERLYTQAAQIIAASSADVVICGANYDAAVTNPPFFRQYILPGLSNVAEILHAKGKLLLTHTDGENQGLCHLYREAGVDVADSVCPQPMTKLTLAEHRKAFDNQVTIWGAIPSVMLLPDSFSQPQFEKYMENLMTEIDTGQRLILSVADTLPPAADFERILYIAQLASNFKVR